MKTKTNAKSYLINIPVYSSELIINGRDLFGGITYKDMNSHIRRKIEVYNSTDQKIKISTRNKVQTKAIDNIEIINTVIGDRSSILLKISAYNTNHHASYVEMDKKRPLKLNH